MKYFNESELFSRFRYPAGESHVSLAAAISGPGPVIIEAHIRNFEGLCGILTADRILRRKRLEARWFLPYFPFARHDRRIDDSDGLELELALELAKDLDLTIADAHSDVSGMLRNIPQHVAVQLFAGAGLFEGEPIVVIPDAGAVKKADTWTGARPTVTCSKHRDPETGKLSGFTIPGGDLGGAPCVIVDDICDGGGTFLGLAKELKAKGAGPLRLAVTHGLFTKGLGPLSAEFEDIFTFAPSDAELATDGSLHTLPFRSLYNLGMNP